MTADIATRAVEPLLLPADEAARLLGISRGHLYKLHASGRLPEPVRLGRAVRWSRRELEDWLAAGAPSRAQWEVAKNFRKRS